MKAAGLQAEDQVGVGADRLPDIPKAFLPNAKEVPGGLRQQIGDDLEMQMRGPTAIFVPIAQMRDHLAGSHGIADLQKGWQGSGQMAVKRVKGNTICIMGQDQGVAIAKGSAL